jgi:chromate reductase
VFVLIYKFEWHAGAQGGALANHNLRQALSFNDIPVLPFELYISNVQNVLSQDGTVKTDSTKKFLESFGKAYLEFASKWLAKSTPESKL